MKNSDNRTVIKLKTEKFFFFLLKTKSIRITRLKLIQKIRTNQEHSEAGKFKNIEYLK